MPVPKKHKTKGRRNTRRSHLAIKPSHFAVCSHCGSATMPHIICSHCGYYKGKEVVNTLAKVEKKAKKRMHTREAEKQDKGKTGEAPSAGSLEELSKKQ